VPATDILITIDDKTYATDFNGFDNCMNAHIRSSAAITLKPWTLNAHLAALGACVQASSDDLIFNDGFFSGKILTHSEIPEPLHKEYAPLALWWACGGETKAEALTDGWYKIGSGRFLLRPWTGGERFAALARSRIDTSDGVRFNPEAYLRSLLNASVVAIEPAQLLENLDSASSSALLDVIISLNALTAPASETLPDFPEMDRLILRFCKALGWTPSQVLATPAFELDLLLAIVERTEAAKPAPRTASGLAAYPDAVVIQIEDD
jgi:hypothetical protein